MNYLVTYDISDDKKRTKLSTILDEYGNRVNFSVYECTLTKREHNILQEKIKSLKILNKFDSIRFYHICKNCIDKSFELGNIDEPFAPKELFI